MDKCAYYDSIGIRCGVRYSDATGGYLPDLWRRKTPAEHIQWCKDNPDAPPDTDWKMIRVGIIQSFHTRAEAEDFVFKRAEEIKEEYKF